MPDKDLENRMVIDSEWVWKNYPDLGYGKEYDERAEDEAVNWFYGAED
jgi:hypothetical protein